MLEANLGKKLLPKYWKELHGEKLLRDVCFLLSVVLSVLLSFSLAISVEAEASWVIWSQTYGATYSDYAEAMVQTSDGGYALAGSTSSFGAGAFDFWLVKTDASGNIEWDRTYGGENWEVADSLVETSDGGYAIVGYTHSYEDDDYDAWLVKTDANGNMEWNQTYKGKNPGSSTNQLLVEASDGGFTLAYATTSSAPYRADFRLVKTDAYGNIEWNHTYGGKYRNLAHSLIKTSDGGYAIAGETDSHRAQSPDFWLIKTDANGNEEWNQTYGGESVDIAHSLVETSDGGYALAGETHSFGAGSYDAWLVKTDGTGNIEWSRTYGGESVDEFSSLVETPDGGYVMAGYTTPIGIYSDMWLVKTNEQGVPEFPSWIILPLFIMVTLVAIIIKKRLTQSSSPKLLSQQSVH